MIQDRPASLPFLPSPLPLFLGPHQLKLETTPLRSKQNKKKDNAKEQLGTTELIRLGSSLCVSLGCQQQQQEQDPTNLYLANLPAHITEQDLHDMLYKYGTVISTRVLRDGGSQSRGVGFARSVLTLSLFS